MIMIDPQKINPTDFGGPSISSSATSLPLLALGNILTLFVWIALKFSSDIYSANESKWLSICFLPYCNICGLAKTLLNGNLLEIYWWFSDFLISRIVRSKFQN